ncbi:MAG: FecR domain-containing protein [Pseudomonadota bacterium]
MSKSDEPQDEERERTREAVRIIRRLDEDPQDKAAQRDRDAFLARGTCEQATYDRTLRAMGQAETGLRRDRGKRYAIAIVGVILASLALAWQPVKLSILADFQTDRHVENIELASGDVVILDAATAIGDETDDGPRIVNLLAGAGYFDVDTSQRSFVVKVDEATVETLGTAFEVSRQGSMIQVTVAEGAVRVSQADQTVTVTAGERLRWQDTPSSRLERVDDAAIAPWRDDVLITDGMTVGEVAAIIDRRILGSVVVLSDELKNTVVSGRLDLTRPTDALRTLAVTVDARVTALSPLGAVLRP